MSFSRVFAVLFMVSGCSEYALNGLSDPTGPIPAGVVGGPGDEAEVPPAEGSLEDAPTGEVGQEMPEDEAWEERCAMGPSGGGQVLTETLSFADPVTDLSIHFGLGDVTVVSRPGPIEVQLEGVALNAGGGVDLLQGRLSLNYADAIGDMTVFVPPDLASYEIRMCVGDLSLSGLGGEVDLEIRIGDVDGVDLQADSLALLQGTGAARLRFLQTPAAVWTDGDMGDLSIEVPTSACDCDLHVLGVGLTSMEGITQDAGAALEVWARRSIGLIDIIGLD